MPHFFFHLLLAFAQRVLANANDWTVHTNALLVKSRLEGKRSRTVERSVLQLQALVDQMDKDEMLVSNRLQHIFATDYVPKWALEQELAARYASVGALRSACDIFVRLELWEDAINCMVVMHEDAKAEALIHAELERSKEVATALYKAKLWCILGDVKNDPELYQKAWEVSEHRLGRAMRALGLYHVKQGQVKKQPYTFSPLLCAASRSFLAPTRSCTIHVWQN